jgi:DNA helicase-2/ATP-dependent DNA helicase PcrA
MPDDEYYSEKWIIKDRINFSAVALSKLTDIIYQDVDSPNIVVSPTQEARYKLSAERLRLLFVGITRARKELIMTWNSGQKGNLREAIPFKALYYFWEREHNAAR